MNLYEMLAETAARHPERTAVLFRGKKIRYRELLEEVNSLASALWEKGLRPGERVGFYLRNHPSFIRLYFALMRIGGVAVPVNFLLTAEELAFILKDSGCVGLLTSDAFLEKAQKGAAKAGTVKWILRAEGDGADPPTAEQWMLRGRILPGPEGVPPSEESLACLLYTSGTTGAPKGAMLTHRNLLANARSCRKVLEEWIGYTKKDRFVCFLPMFHSFAWMVCVLTAFICGLSTLAVETIQPFEPVLKQILRHRVTLVPGVPPLFSAVAKKIRIPRFLRPLARLFIPVRICISGAAALPVPVLEAFQKNLGIPLLEGYGLTEASPVVSLNPPGRMKPGSVGLPIPEVEVKIAGEDGRPLAAGEVGEVCVRGANVMRGYWNLPEDTREAIRDGWLHTGDMGRLDEEGYLYIVDRKKDLVIVKGLNVYPREVEEVLLSHPAVAEAAVIGIPDSSGDEQVRAYVIPKEGAAVEKSELFDLCRRKLAPYKRPRQIEIRAELPKNPLGKISKKDLRAEARSSST